MPLQLGSFDFVVMTLAFATALVPPLEHLTPRKPQMQAINASALVQIAALCVLVVFTQITYMVFLVHEPRWAGGDGSSDQVKA